MTEKTAVRRLRISKKRNKHCIAASEIIVCDILVDGAQLPASMRTYRYRERGEMERVGEERSDDA